MVQKIKLLTLITALGMAATACGMQRQDDALPSSTTRDDTGAIESGDDESPIVSSRSDLSNYDSSNNNDSDSNDSEVGDEGSNSSDNGDTDSQDSDPSSSANSYSNSSSASDGTSSNNSAGSNSSESSSTPDTTTPAPAAPINDSGLFVSTTANSVDKKLIDKVGNDIVAAWWYSSNDKTFTELANELESKDLITSNLASEWKSLGSQRISPAPDSSQIIKMWPVRVAEDTATFQISAVNDGEIEEVLTFIELEKIGGKWKAVGVE